MIETTFVIITPDAVKKQLAGIVLSRIMMRCKAELTAAQLIKSTSDTAQKLSAVIPVDASLLDSDSPAMFCLFSGENAFENIRKAIDELTFSLGGKPAAAVEKAKISQVLIIISAAGCVENLLTPAPAAGEERTLLIIKPENFRNPSCRPGTIIDILMSLDLKWVGCKVHGMTTNDALEFYGPVQQALRNKLGPKIGNKALAAIENEFGFKFSTDAAAELVKTAGNAFADDQFEQIVEFMSGKRPSAVPENERNTPGGAKCMVLIFDGIDAVAKIRTILGPTNPAEASGGTVRCDFGTDIMVNAAHASDSVANYERESVIVRVNENDFCKLAQKLV